MKNNKIDTTSPLRQERNDNNPRTFLQSRNGTGFGRLYTMFKKVLLETTLRPGTISGICTDLIPFCAYLTEICGVSDIAGISRSHVEGYVAAMHSAYASGDKRPHDVYSANMQLTALSLMCLYLHWAGVVAQDYGLLVPADKRMIRGVSC